MLVSEVSLLNCIMVGDLYNDYLLGLICNSILFQKRRGDIISLHNVAVSVGQYSLIADLFIRYSKVNSNVLG